MEIKTMIIKKSAGITLMAIFICFTVFFFSYNQYTQQWTIQEMAKHAEIIKADIWETNYEGTRAYLTLVADRENYSKIEIKYANVLLLAIEGPRLNAIDSILNQIGLFPERIIINDINYDGQIIGTLTGYHRDTSFYVHFIAFVLFVLIYIIIRMILYITKRKIAENEIKSKNRIQSAQLRLINNAQELSSTALLQKFLDEAEVLTQSAIGFYHFLSKDEKIISLQAWSTNTMETECNAAIPGHYPVDQAGIWCECVQKRKTVIHNNYRNLENKKGLPDGHAPLIRELVVPIFRNKKIVAILGVGNKPLDYTPADAQTLEIIAELAWETVIRKKTEERISTSEEKFRLAFLTSPDSITLSRIKDGIYLEINEGFSQLMGYSRQEVMGKSSIELNIWKNIEDRDRLVFMLKKDGIVENLEMEFLTRSGTVILGMTSARMLCIENENCILSITRDITEQRRLELQYLQNQKMESIGTLAGGIAHDFNNILFPILGHSEMLLKDLPVDDFNRKSINAIHTSALRARNLVGQILTFSRQHKDEIKSMQIQPILNESLQILRATIPATIEIKQHIATDCCHIKADPTQIQQMIINLATNAFHAMEEKGGILTIGLSSLHLNKKDLITPLTMPGQYVLLSVKDTGEGIPDNIAEKIFEPFYTTKAKGKGTGLGLSVVHGIVKKFGGAIELETKVGGGSEFKIYLPMESMDYYAQPASPEPIHKGSERILIVDDDESVIKIETQMLERLGYSVSSTTDSIDALECFKTAYDDFDLVISDLDMPKMAGDKLARQLLSIKPDIPILLCTGFSNTLTPRTLQEIGIKGLLNKPIILKDLAKKIREIIDE